LKPILLGITGASGAIYALRFAEHARRLGYEVEAVVTEAGMQVLRYEKSAALLENCMRIYANNDFFAAPASGSSDYTGMAVLPCSMGTLGKIAAGLGDNLLTRAADVCLKERRPLVLVPREMPLSALHLENMLRLQRAGAVILPACPHFYQHPSSIDDLVDTVLAKVFSQLGLPHDLSQPWGNR